MEYVLRISPVLARWLSDETKNGAIVLIDVDPDVLTSSNLKLRLNVIISPISIRRGIIERADYYIGCTGIQVEVKSEEGTIIDFTEHVTLDVNYSNAFTRNQTGSLKLTPKLQVKGAKSEMKVEPFEVSYQAGQQLKFACSFQSEERLLTAIFYGDKVRWDMSLPRGEKAIQDFVSGNLYLKAELAWLKEQKRGQIIVRPIDWRFFSPDRRPLGKRKSLVMYFILKAKGKKVYFKDGIDAEFLLEGC